MIQSGGWSGLRAPDEHTKLARISIGFSPSLDEAFKVNVAKMRVQMPVQIRDSVREATVPVIKMAREIYDRKSAEPALASSNQDKQSTHPLSRNNASGPVSEKDKSGTEHRSPQRLTLEEWSERILTVSKRYERPIIRAVLKRL
jgi:hypothetical protein